MKYLILGAGGTGGSLAAFLAAGGKDVAVIARGEHLRAIRERGLTLERLHRGSFTVPVEASDMDHYAGAPDVIFLCVKSYSLEECVPFLRRVARPETVVIPILNVFGTGGMLQSRLPGPLVTDGCIYIMARIKQPGTILLEGDIFRVVFGPRRAEEYRDVLEEIARDLTECGIRGEVSRDIRRDALEKFSFVSPMAACGLYCGVTAGAMQRPGREREIFLALVREVEELAAAMGVALRGDLEQVNLGILDSLEEGSTASLQRDVAAGRASELDGLVFRVVRLGREFGVSTPWYSRTAEKFGYSGEEETP